MKAKQVAYFACLELGEHVRVILAQLSQADAEMMRVLETHCIKVIEVPFAIVYEMLSKEETCGTKR